MRRLRLLRVAGSRILDLPLTLGLIVIGYAALGRGAWDGDKFSVVVLTISSIFWALMAIWINRKWGKTIEHWGTTIENTQEFSNLHSSMARLMEEALSELVEYDSEVAVDIAERANTVMRLHSQNFKEVK